MALGLSGGKGSAGLRQQLLQKLEFPENMSANALLQALNLLLTLEELTDMVKTLEHNDG